MGRLFGTDGVRGRAGTLPLDVATIRRLGAALVRVLRPDGQPVRFFVGRDTRESGPWIEREFAFGAASEGAEVTSAGVLPTPAVAFLTPRAGATAGIVISASHNPFEDNGIKVFSGSGEKLTEDQEARIEAAIDDDSWRVPDGEAGPVAETDRSAEYIDHVTAILPVRPVALRVAVDCAHGATVSVAPRVFRALGLDATFIGDAPDGRNINLDCGSTHPERLAELVVRGGHRLGIAFDGDGDRAIFVDAQGRVVDGDAIMLLCALQMKAEGRLRNNAIAATVMSNIGLEIALREAGITLLRTNVGDKHVMEQIARRGLALGGEQSGHIIFADDLSTGDGLATAAHVLRTMVATGRELADLASALTTYPQVLLNVRVQRRVDLTSVPEVAAAMAVVEARLAGNGRLLVRYSGTEPLVRVMLEGRDRAEIERWGREIIDAIVAADL